MTGGDWGVIVAGVGSIVATVCGFVLAFRRDSRTTVEQLSAGERTELELRRRWYRLVTLHLHVPLRDWFAERGTPEPVDFDKWTRYPPEDDS